MPSVELTQQIAAGQITSKGVWLMDISHASFDTFNLVANTEDMVVGSITYRAVGLSTNQPSQVQDELPFTRATLTNFDATLHNNLRAIDAIALARPIVTVRWVLAVSPTIVESGPFTFQIDSVTGNELVLELTLGEQELLVKTFPTKRFGPREFPALFP